MVTLLTIIHVVAALFMVIVILLQSGKGGGMGAVFGGASQTFFGGHGAGNFLAKITTTLAVTFMLTSMGLSILGSSTDSVVSGQKKPAKSAQTESLAPKDGATDVARQIADMSTDHNEATLNAEQVGDTASAAEPQDREAGDSAANNEPAADSMKAIKTQDNQADQTATDTSSE